LFEQYIVLNLLVMSVVIMILAWL